MKIFNKYIRPDTPKREKYNPIVKDYDFVRNEKGILEIKEVGQHNEDEAVQSHAHEVGIENLMKKIQIGQPIQTREGFYADISTLPTDTLNTRDLEKALKEAEKQLADIKAKQEQLTKSKEPIKETTENGQE